MAHRLPPPARPPLGVLFNDPFAAPQLRRRGK
jgi:hypothetical protein